MKHGKVQWFNDSKGFGFITQADGGEPLFVHYSAIQGAQYKSLSEGEPVTYTVASSGKGDQAGQVWRAGGSDACE